MELIGWIESEGCFIKRGNYKCISIFQTNGTEKFSRIEKLLQKLNLPYSIYDRRFDIKADDLFNELSVIGKSTERFIPLKYKNQGKKGLARLLEGLILGDGEKHRNGGGYTYTTTSERLAKDVSEIAVKVGLNSVIRKREGKEFVAPNGKTYLRKAQYRVSITYDNPMLYPKPQREYYKGNIVCVRVEKNNTILTRYNGHIAWVGNCNPCNENTWAYFDPLEPRFNGQLYKIYKPKPWRIKMNTWHSNGNLEVVLVKRRIDKSYYE